MKQFIGMTLWLFVAALCLGASASAQEAVIVGVPTSLTALEGKESLRAVEMAVEEINAKGGVKVGDAKKPIKIETIDLRDASPGVPVDEAQLGLERIITEKKVNAIVVGPFRSEALLAGMEILAKFKVPMLGTIAMSPKSEEKVRENPDKYKYCFRVCLNSKYLVKYLSDTLNLMHKEFGFTKLFIMHQDVLWAKATGELTAKQAAGKTGWETIGTDAYQMGAKDYSTGLAIAKAKGAQVIMPVFDMPDSGILVRQWHSNRIPAMLMGFVSPMAGPGAWKAFDGKIGGAINVSFEIGSAIPTEKYAPAKKFYDDYLKKYGQPMEAGHGPAPSYDAIHILAAAIERAGSLDPDKVVAELKKTDHKGVIGRIRFDEGNQAIFGDDPNETAVGCVAQWTMDGKRVIVLPQPIAEGQIQLPEWIKPAR